MALAVLDVGFDMNANPDPNNENLPLLLVGGVNFDSSNNPSASLAVPHFKVGDLFSFNGFNLTAGAQQSDCIITHYKVLFREGITQDVQSPVNSSIFELDCNLHATGMEVSVQLSPSTAVPAYWPIVSFGSIANKGTFNFAVWLTVQGPGGKVKVFRVDPEMIIDSAG